MIETDKQRRWWFANHPEFSHQSAGRRGVHSDDNDEERDKISPDDVIAYVDKAFEHLANPVIVAVLKALKKGAEEALGSDGEGSDLLDWTIEARGHRGGFGRLGGRQRRGPMETRDWFLMNRALRESLDRVEEDLETAGANHRDYRFKSYEGRDVAQRDSTFEPYQRNPDGTTNMVRMLRGEPPRDREGKEVVLHHSSQLNKGPYVEMTRSEHREVRIRREPSEINRSEHNSFRKSYWKQRAREILER